MFSFNILLFRFHMNVQHVNCVSEALPTMPVVHMSYKDSVEYCAWAGGIEGLRRLPSEHEWEYAARGGRQNETYPWGKSTIPTSHFFVTEMLPSSADFLLRCTF